MVVDIRHAERARGGRFGQDVREIDASLDLKNLDHEGAARGVEIN